MKKIKNLILGILLYFLIFGCQKEMIDFQGENGVYFEMRLQTMTGLGIGNYADTTSVPFASTTKNDTIDSIKFKLFGRVSDTERTFHINISDSSTAVMGQEYDEFPLTVTMPAGVEYCYLPITIHRTDAILNEHKYLILEITPSSDFPFLLKRVKTQEGDDNAPWVDVTRHTIDISDALFKPLIWLDVYLGDYSDYKFRLLNEKYDLTQEDWSTQQLMPTAKVKYIGMTFKRYLIEQEDAGTPIYERDRYGEIIYKKKANGEFELDSEGNKIPVKLTMGVNV